MRPGPHADLLGLPGSEPAPYPRHRPVPTREARTLDARAGTEFGLPGLVLMEHAARGLAILAQRLAPRGRPVAVVCGPGNNGGDGYGAARHLVSWGTPVRLFRAAPGAPAGPDAALEARLAAALVPAEDAWEDLGPLEAALGEAGLVVDALFGVGLRPPGLPPRWVEIVRLLRAAPGICLAADVPSGLDADTGEELPLAVRAQVTATMGLPKPGILPPSPGARLAGRVLEVDIGLPASLHQPYRI